MTATKITPKKILYAALGLFSVASLAMVVVYFIKKKKSADSAEKASAKKEQEVLAQHGGNQPPIIVYPQNSGTGSGGTPTTSTDPVIVTDVPAHIKKLCWMANECSKTGGTSEYRCEICNNLKALGNLDIALWAETYRIWYGTTLKEALSKDFVDCGCIFWAFSGCSCTKPNLDRLP